MNQEFKILSLDGGGIKGLYTAKVLSHLEDAFGSPIGQYFDMICGTSTGGLIALALSKGVPASELVRFYTEHGPHIFSKVPIPYVNGVWQFMRQTFLWGKYSNTYLGKALTEVLGDTMMSQANNLLCIPTFNLSTGRPRVFKYPHAEGNNYAEKYGSMVEAALATSAAPTYFPVKFTNNCYYADGGVWANNPTLCGLQEALEYFVGPDKQLKGVNRYNSYSSYNILSLACLPQKNGWAHRGTTVDRKMPFIKWRDKLFETSLDGQSHFADNFTSKLIHQTKVPGKYHRIEGPKNISTAQQALVALDNASTASIQTLLQFGNEVGDEYRTRSRQLIEPFFEYKKTYKTI